MNKSLTIIGLGFLIFGSALNAQSPGFGIKAGINHSNVWDEEGQDFEADGKFGFAGGVFLGIPIGEQFGFQPEVLVSQKGFQGSGTLLGTPYSVSRTTTHIDIPLQLQLRPADVLTFLVGPQFSFLLHRKDEYIFGANGLQQEREFKNDNIRKNILGVVAGTDFTFSTLMLSGRAGWDLLANNGDGSSSTPRYKNVWVQLTMGLMLK